MRVSKIAVDRSYAAECNTRWVWSLDFISVPNKQARTPKKYGRYEYPQNCAECLE